MSPDDTARLARELLFAYDDGDCVEPPSRRTGGFDMVSAYGVARAILSMRLGRGDAFVGRKIGFTNRNIWAQYGVDSPIWAPIYSRTLHRAAGGTATHRLAGSVSPRIEPEIAFGLAAGIDANERDLLRILDSIEWVAPAFEIVDCHYANWTFAGPDAVADQAFHSALFLGKPCGLQAAAPQVWIEQLRECEVTLACNGTDVEKGRGSNALGHPVGALAFLARTLTEYPGFPLLGIGEVVSTGTLTSALPVARGETWSMRFAGLSVEPLSLHFA